MKSIATTIIIGLLFVILGLNLVFFQVRETESAIVVRFGKPLPPIVEPGLHFRLPAPIDRVYKFDSRMRVLEAPYAETTTKGAVTIIVNTYVVWRISDPLQFFNAHGGGSFMEATKKLRNQINDTQNRVIGQHAFGEFVNSDPTKVRFQQIEQEMQAELQHNIAAANYGIEIKTLGIKQLKVSESVSKDVFARMRAERDSETAKIIAQGASLAMKIRTDAEAKRMELLAAAEARAKAIRGQAEADAAKYYSLLQENPELAIFLRNVEALKEILKKNTTYVVPVDIEPFTLLNKIPDIQGKK